MTIEINGMAHVILTVSQFDAARAFYKRLLPEFKSQLSCIEPAVLKHEREGQEQETGAGILQGGPGARVEIPAEALLEKRASSRRHRHL